MPALANVSPGIGAVSLLFMLWLSILLFTAIGGGYVIRKKMLAEKGKKQSLQGIAYTIIVTVSLLLAGATVGYLMFAALFAGGMALERAVRMILWSRSSRNPEGRPSYLEGLNPSRLVLASWLLITSAVILVPVSITLALQTGDFYHYAYKGSEKVKTLRAWTTEEMRIRNSPDVFNQEKIRNELLSLRESYQSSSLYTCILPGYSAEGKKFTILMVPNQASFLWPAISFRADETGKIRAAKVYKPGAVCPDDAKIITEVRESEKDYVYILLRL